jgi:hypothetical protein
MQDRGHFRTEHANRFYVGYSFHGSIRVPPRVTYMVVVCRPCVTGVVPAHLVSHLYKHQRHEYY